MRVLFHIPFPVIGGAELQIQYLIKNFSPDVTPIITYEHSEVEKFVKSLKVEDYRVFSPLSLAKAIDRARPEIIQFYHSHTCFGALSKLRVIPKVIEVVHNRLPFGGDATCYPKCFTSMVVGVSEDATRNFESKVANTSTITIPNGIDTSVFHPGIRSNRKVLPGARPVGGFTGRLEAGDGKGIPLLIDIVSKLPIDFELVGKDYGRYQEYCVQRGYNNIRFFPYTGDVTPYYSRWDFFISTSPAEGFGLSIAEAICSGVPSVVWDCGGVCQYLEHNKHAILCSSTQEVVDGINRIIGGDAKLTTEGLDLSAKTMAARYEELYNSLLGYSSKPSSSECLTPPQELPKTLNKNKLLAVCPADWWGVRRSLASFTTDFADPTRAVKAIRELKPRAVVFGCYSPQWENVLLTAKKMGCKVVITWHASYILNEFDHINREWMWHMMDAHRRGLVDFIATPHEGLAQTWSHFGMKADFLPNLIDKIPPVGSKAPGRNIGIFGSSQPWKNVECQVIAAKMIVNANVHTQGLKHRQSLEALGIQTTEHKYIPSDEEYMKLMGSMSVNMCCSLSETYSFFTAESMLCGTPIIGTPIIPIFRRAPTELQKCVCPYFEDPMAIKETILSVLDDVESIGKLGREYMIELNETNKVIAANVTAQWVD